MLKQLILVNFCFSLTACGTIMSLADNDLSVYAGVRKDLVFIQQGDTLGSLMVIDLPLSFVMDTLLLPISLSQ